MKKLKPFRYETENSAVQVSQKLGWEFMTRGIEERSRLVAERERWGEITLRVPPGVREVVLDKLDEVARCAGFDVDKGGWGRAMEVIFADLEPTRYTQSREGTGG